MAAIVDEIDLIIKNKPVQNIFLQMPKKPRKYRTKFVFSFHDWSSFAKAGNRKNDILRSFKTGIQVGMMKPAITQRAREILLPLYAKKTEEKAKSENVTAKDKVKELLRNSREGLTTKKICEALDIRRETFQLTKKNIKNLKRYKSSCEYRKERSSESGSLGVAVDHMRLRPGSVSLGRVASHLLLGHCAHHYDRWVYRKKSFEYFKPLVWIGRYPWRAATNVLGNMFRDRRK